MPDLTIEAAWTCCTNVEWQTEVVGSRGDKHVVHYGLLEPVQRRKQGCLNGWTCSCQGFKFRGTCRHIEQVKGDRCAWNAVLEPSMQAEVNAAGERCCPLCGGPVTVINVGV